MVMPDLFITRLGFYAGDGQLFRNNGDGTFTDVTEHAGLNVWGPTFLATWVDYDSDGFLDLFMPIISPAFSTAKPPTAFSTTMAMELLRK